MTDKEVQEFFNKVKNKKITRFYWRSGGGYYFIPTDIELPETLKGNLFRSDKFERYAKYKVYEGFMKDSLGDAWEFWDKLDDSFNKYACSCGSAHTSRPDYHLPWCDKLEGKL